MSPAFPWLFIRFSRLLSIDEDYIREVRKPVPPPRATGRRIDAGALAKIEFGRVSEGM